MSDLEKRITAKMVLDDSGYSATLKGINATLKENKSELKAATSGLEAFGRSTANIERVQKAFQEQLETQSKKVQLYKDSIKKATDTLNKNVAARERLTKSISQEEEKLEALKRQYGENNVAVEKVDSKLEKLRQQLERTENSIENNSKRIQSYSTQLNRCEDELNRVTVASNKFNEELLIARGIKSTTQKINDASDSFKKFGAGAVALGGKLTSDVTLPLGIVAGAVGVVGTEFESKMSRVKAISGATAEEFKKLEEQALDLGKSTAFSASQCADGMENLSSAGFTVSQTMEAMPGLLDLAASSGEDLAISSDIAASTLRGFGMEASEAGKVADILAKNAAETNAAVVDTGEAMKYVAPNAHAAGLKIYEVTAAIGKLADAGIKGSQAGTTLRTALVRLAKPADPAATAMERIGFNAFDASGKMKPLSTIIGELNEKTKDLTEAEKQKTIATIFGTEALSGMTVLMQTGKDELDNLTEEFRNCDGAAKEMAATMQDNTKASIEQAMGALETAGIKTLKAAAPMIKEVAEVVGNLADKFSELSPETQEFIVKAGLATLAAGPLTSGIGHLASGVGGLIKVGGKLAGGLGLITTGAEVATTATAAVGAAAEGTALATGTAGLAASGFGATLAGLALPIAGTVAAVAAVGYGAYKTAEYLNEDATPAVDLFADKAVYSTQQVATAHGTMTAQVQTDTIKISKATKDNVQAYLDLDKKASNSLMDLRINSDKFTKEAKDKVIKNFEEMSKKSSKFSDEQKKSMITDFKNLVVNTGTLSKKNKDEIIKQYSTMVNATKNLSAKQKIQLIKDFQDTLNKSTAITKKQSQDLQKLYKDMSDKIKTGLDKKRDEDLKSQKNFFEKSNAITTAEEAKILKDTKDFWNDKKTAVDELQKKITDIIEKASNEHRQITNAEAKTIDEIQKKMKENAVKTLSENEVQAKVILERIKDHDANITAEQAAQHIQTLNKSRDDAIKAANEECDKRIAEIIRMKEETKVISEEQKNKLIEDAQKQRDETVKAAEETRNQAVEKITAMNSSIEQNVDTTTGNVLSRWEKFKRWWSGWTPETKELRIRETHYSDGRGGIEENWTGNSYFKGGYTTLHERGYELYDLPSGTKIYNHESSEAMVLETARQTAQIVAESILNNEEGSSGDIVIPISIAGEEIDRIIVPRVSNKLAQNIRKGR
ncbi:phage tail tape measure protein [Clostridium sp. B9]|uniref:phage tail tape measure protein n=1 Tax=Clostridium sp. B9 TaxID=3423224 RepID=UPI003D2F05D1